MAIKYLPDDFGKIETKPSHRHAEDALKDDRLKKAQAAFLRAGVERAAENDAKGLRDLVEAVRGPVTDGDCHNPSCPYRAEVLKTRAKTKARVDRFRQRSKP